MIKRVLSLVVLCCFIMTSYAQEFQIPDYKLEKAEDYDKYEKDVVAATKWLIETPVKSQKEKRLYTQAFLLKWLEGSPRITINISDKIVTFMETPDAFMIYMAGWASYCIENKDYKNDLQGNIRGIENVITFYNNNKKALGRIKAIERYKKLQKKGKLEAHLKSKL